MLYGRCSLFDRRRFLDFLDHLCWRSHSDREGWNITSNDRVRTDSAALSNRHSWYNRHMASDPAVVANGNFSGIFDVFTSRLDLRLVCRRKDADIRTKHDPIAYSHDPTIENHGTVDMYVQFYTYCDVMAPKRDQRLTSVNLLEIRVESISNGDIATIVNV